MKNIKLILPLLALIVLTGGLLLTMPVSAAPDSQSALPTPTAQPDGRIIYIAQPGDSWWIISVKTGVSESQLYLLNNASPDDVVLEGQQILLGLVTETPIPPASDATATPNILTPAVNGYGQVCVALFDDLNGDSVRQESEPLIADGAVSLVDQAGQINQTEDTLAGENAVCFNELPEGDYNVSVAVPDGYNPTTSLNSPLKLLAGEVSTMNFGAQLNSQTSPISPSQGGRNPILGILGGILILGGVVVAFFFLRPKRMR
jgi:hypothetical protein